MDSSVFKKSISYTPLVILVGIALGVGDYVMGWSSHLLRAIVVHTVTALSIGLSSIFVAKSLASEPSDSILPKQYVMSALILFGVAVGASEIETINKAVLDPARSYAPFSAGGLYLFNMIISLILGFGLVPAFRGSDDLRPKQNTDGDDSEQLSVERIPLKKGNATYFLASNEIVLIEAADKYANLYDISGSKHLCDYSISALTDKIPDVIRIHRSFSVNPAHIKSIEAFDKNRFMVNFASSHIPTVRSSATYAGQLKTLLKI